MPTVSVAASMATSTGSLQVAADEVADVAVERGREQHRLRPGGAVAQDPLDLRREAVVGHAVGLVEDDDVDVGEDELVRLQQVDQPQRRGDDDVDALLQCVDLVLADGAAVHGRMRWPACAATGPSTSATWIANSRVGTSTSPSGRAGSAALDDAGEHRHAEGERLAGAGAGSPAHVAAVQRDGDGGGLDLERLGEPGGGEAVVDLGGTPRAAKPVGASTAGRTATVVSAAGRVAPLAEAGRR